MLKIEFINVGKGNCTIIDFPSKHLSVVDLDNSRHTDENDLTDPVDYLKENYSNRNIFRLIITHPDMDHISGIKDLDDEFEVINFWDTDHNKELSEEDLDKAPYYEKDDWNKYLEYRKSEESPKRLFLYQGANKDYWNSDNVTILSPTKDLVDKANESGEYNHLSYVLMIEYAGVKILLGGDATTAAWDEILEKVGEDALKADIFLAPHHGSTHNVNKEVFKRIDPDYVIVSVIRKVEYDYDYYNSLANKSLLSTKHYGNIKINIEEDGSYLPIKVEKNGN